MSTDKGMTVVTALIRPQMEGHVVSTLHGLPEFPGFTIVEVRGQGRGRGVGGSYRANEFDLTYQRLLQLQIVCSESAVPQICGVIAAAAWTGQKGDGVIFTSVAGSFARIREVGRREEHRHD